MSHLGKVRQYSWNERWLLFRSILLLPLIHLALLVLKYSRLRAAMEKLTPLKPVDVSHTEVEILQQGQGIARIVSVASQHGLYKATCLRRSLLVWWFLRREGVDSRICFGVRKNNHRLEAHAWVEYQGIIVNDSANIRDIYQMLEDGLPPTKLGL